MQYSDNGRIACECWRAIPDHFPNVELGAFVIMPNHVHGIIILRAAIKSLPVGAHHDAPLHVQPGSLGSIIRQYKSSVTRKIVKQYGSDGKGRAMGRPDVWQRNYYEHIIRDDEEHKRIHLYIESNPVRWDTDEENPEK